MPLAGFLLWGAISCTPTLPDVTPPDFSVPPSSPVALNSPTVQAGLPEPAATLTETVSAAETDISTAEPSPETTASFQIYSPLEGIEIPQLEGMITNPFNPPPAGSDDPHAGVDLSDLLPDTQIAIAGRTVLAVLDGRVAGLIPDRFPYGNAIILETALADLPAGWVNSLQIPAMSDTPITPIALSCPQGIPDYENTDGESLYILYAHLEQTPALAMGDAVQIGQALGTVGMSGNALNPHLHVEMRVGPAGVPFNSMAHYDASASLDEMTSYCTWRVGGQFRLIDPMALFMLHSN